MFSNTTSIRTDGVLVSVRTAYVDAQSSPQLGHYVFAYKILIRNESTQTVQLLCRQWFIKDAIGKTEVVNGEGVVGQKPVLAPGESHEYMSGSNFRTPIGQMYGYYIMARPDGTEFKVRIPKFTMVFPSLLN
jgi:ApaG protein